MRHRVAFSAVVVAASLLLGAAACDRAGTGSQGQPTAGPSPSTSVTATASPPSSETVPAGSCEAVAGDVIALALIPHTVELSDSRDDVAGMEERVRTMKASAPADVSDTYQRIIDILERYASTRFPSTASPSTTSALPSTASSTASSTATDATGATASPTASTPAALDRAALDEQIDTLRDWLAQHCRS